MKFYSSLDRSPSFGLADRLSRLLTFDFRAQFSVESGTDILVSVIVFGQGLTLGFTRGMPHIVGGVYVEVNALTERFSATAGFQSDWYDTYTNEGLAGISSPLPAPGDGQRLIDGEHLAAVQEHLDRLPGGCAEGCCSHEDVAECHDAPKNTTLGDLSFEREMLAKAICPQHGPIQNCGSAHDDVAGLSEGRRCVHAENGDTKPCTGCAKPCAIARHRDIGCPPDCPSRI